VPCFLGCSIMYQLHVYSSSITEVFELEFIAILQMKRMKASSHRLLHTALMYLHPEPDHGSGRRYLMRNVELALVQQVLEVDSS